MRGLSPQECAVMRESMGAAPSCANGGSCSRDTETVSTRVSENFALCESLASRGLMKRYECEDFVHFRVTDLGLALYRIATE